MVVSSAGDSGYVRDCWRCCDKAEQREFDSKSSRDFVNGFLVDRARRGAFAVDSSRLQVPCQAAGILWQVGVHGRAFVPGEFQAFAVEMLAIRENFPQQFNETTNAFGRVRDIINDNFSDTATKGVSRRHPRFSSRSSLPHFSLASSSQPRNRAKRRRRNIEFQGRNSARFSAGTCAVSRN
jgi:hypothetical protein